MQRYLRVYRKFFLSSLARELEFRANFFAKIAGNLVWIFFFLMILLVVYRNTDQIAGWTRGEAFVLAATTFLMNSISAAFFMSLMEIPQHVRQGTLDFVITKPIDTQFWISARRFNFDQIGTLVAGAVMVWVGVMQASLHPSALAWLGWAVLVLAATIIFYSFNLMLMTTGIWLVRVDNLWVLGESVMQVARYPLDIYSTGLQRVFTYALPLAFLATVPARQLTQSFDLGMVLFGVCWAAVFLLAGRLFWRFALRHYTSASS